MFAHLVLDSHATEVGRTSTSTTAEFELDCFICLADGFWGLSYQHPDEVTTKRTMHVIEEIQGNTAPDSRNILQYSKIEKYKVIQGHTAPNKVTFLAYTIKHVTILRESSQTLTPWSCRCDIAVGISEAYKKQHLATSIIATVGEYDPAEGEKKT
ncbi:hypothetical protein MLD38_018590 [Melastoma candidum]|uniref:Uncharacterized protein n=1 Tax=Melastoma candidum TaxID=119954 RepID=A0ACB9QUU2_9MYRT|nr:hypothetical protein MLD38_018590 [Melastoma candidum]